ncbi:MAG TPA: hypothetical protein VFV87_09845 [Pirellulaceae bacterium]|nr:hypothetical protein [Pirellulaceae bacterium]
MQSKFFILLAFLAAPLCVAGCGGGTTGTYSDKSAEESVSPAAVASPPVDVSTTPATPAAPATSP